MGDTACEVISDFMSPLQWGFAFYGFKLPVRQKSKRETSQNKQVYASNYTLFWAA